jgi:hypothetical protein
MPSVPARGRPIRRIASIFNEQILPEAERRGLKWMKQDDFLERDPPEISRAA